MQSVGYAVHDLVQPDGKVRFGTFESTLQDPPINFGDLDGRESARQDATINYTIIAPEEDRIESAQFIPNVEK